MQIRIANIIRGTLIGNTMSVLTRYISRVVNGGGIVEKPQCVETALNSQSILQQASLLVVPSGYKGGTLYSEIPTNGNGDLIWTRGGDAFRTNASGVLQRVPWNLLTNSNELVSQQLQALGKYTISSNVAISPDGTQTADKFVITGTDSYQGVVKTPIQNGTYTISMFAKAAGKNWVFFYEIGSPSGTNGVWFNISTGQIGSIGSAWSNVTITNVGNDWYRCSATTTLSATNYLYWLVADSNSNPIVTANGTDGVLMWGLQFVEGTTAQTYLPTTDRLNFPRLSYMYGSCPSALLEPQRTNLVTWSDAFDNASWLKLLSTVTANQTTSPDGTTNADKLFENATNGFHSIYQSTSNATGLFTLSCYAKSSERNWLILDIFTGATGGDCLAWFDLNNGVVGSTTNGSGSSSTTSTIQSVGNGWYRCSVTVNKTSATGGNSSIAITTGNNITSYAGNSSNGLFIYGAQLEAGAYPTTYIPTTSATATRVADSSRTTGRSSLIGQSEGTLFVDLYYLPLQNQARAIAVTETSNPLTNRLIININNTNNRVSVISRQSSSLTNGSMNESPSTVLLNGRNKIALGYKSGDSVLYINGVQVATNTDSFTFSATLNDIFLMTSEINLVADNVGFVNSSALFTTRLTNAQLTTLTTL